jgi:hypothetical protein
MDCAGRAQRRRRFRTHHALEYLNALRPQLPLSTFLPFSPALVPPCSRSSRVDYGRFVEIAAGSVFDVVSQATIGRNQHFLAEADYQRLYQAAEKQSRMQLMDVGCIQISGMSFAMENNELADPVPPGALCP